MSFDIKHHFSAGVYLRQQYLKAGLSVGTHKHTYDHFGLLAKGSAVVQVDGAGRTYEAPCVIEIRAGKYHTITALTDIDWFCIHATEVTDPEQIEAELTEEH